MKIALFFSFKTAPEQPPKAITHPLIQNIVHRPFPVLDYNAYRRHIALQCRDIKIDRLLYINPDNRTLQMRAVEELPEKLVISE
jgi:hypothetical protein